ncbi:MAG: 4Fe-4S ferredoxin [Deltaproteobacteria bacterium]|nr:4Fe-4S ferredoxin [Deltaproteobacteria bacterium]
MTKDRLEEWAQGVLERMPVLAPVETSAGPDWGPVQHFGHMIREFVNTVTPLKSLFFPQTECMMRFLNEPRSPEGMVMRPVPFDSERLVILNVRPCEARSLVLLDAIFLQDPACPDVYWQAKRQNSILVGLACNEPCPSSFCMAMQCGPHHEEGFDLLFVDVGEGYVVRVLSEAGETLVKGLPSPKRGDSVRAGRRRRQAEAAAAVAVYTDHIAEAEVLDLFHRKFWEEAAFTCLNCGACTFFCPTCHCFDIQDEVSGASGQRVRNWDTCMSRLFTQHASGHNPRATKTDRFRQRFMHKFKYIPMRRNGMMGCVGCGRCTRLCPVNIDVREIVARMNEAEGVRE